MQTLMSADAESKPFLEDEPLRHATVEATSSWYRWTKALRSGLPKSSSQWISNLVVLITTSLAWSLALLYMRSGHDHLAIPENTFLELKASDFVETYGSFANGARFLSCGFSIGEAKALGCEYDILTGKYLPPFCIDRSAIEMYKADGSWFGYADRNRTELLSIEQMGTQDVYYTSIRDHIMHCANLWKKQFQAVFEGRRVIDSIIASKEHTFHCAHYMAEMAELKTDHWNTPIPVFVSQAGCFVKP
jgi:hypothetical protein